MNAPDYAVSMFVHYYELHLAKCVTENIFISDNAPLGRFAVRI